MHVGGLLLSSPTIGSMGGVATVLDSVGDLVKIGVDKVVELNG